MRNLTFIEQQTAGPLGQQPSEEKRAGEGLRWRTTEGGGRWVWIDDGGRFVWLVMTGARKEWIPDHVWNDGGQADNKRTEIRT